MKVLKSQEQVLTLYKIPLKPNVMEFIFRNAAGLHLQRLLRNKYLLSLYRIRGEGGGGGRAKRLSTSFFPVTCTNAEIQTILTYGLDLSDQKFEDHT